MSECVFAEDGNYNSIMGGLRAELNAVADWWLGKFSSCSFVSSFGFVLMMVLGGVLPCCSKNKTERGGERERERELTLASERRDG